MSEPVAPGVDWSSRGLAASDVETDDGSLFYGVALAYIRPRDACIAASGYAFRHGIAPTPEQLHATCAASPCIELANEMLFMRELGEIPDVKYEIAVRGWVYPMIDYCMLHHIPSDPCPVDPLAQLLFDLKPIVDVCEVQSGVSVMGVIERGIRVREASSFSGSGLEDDVVGIGSYDQEVASMCAVPECDNLIYRLAVKYQKKGSCPFTRPNDVYFPLVGSYRHLCGVANRLAWYNFLLRVGWGDSFYYRYLPGPLPLSPSPSPSPSPQISSSFESTLPASVVSRPPTSAPTTTPSLPPSSVTVKARPTASPNKTQQTRAADASVVVGPVPANQTLPLPPTLASVDGEATPPDATAMASLKNLSSGSATLQYSVAALVAVVVLTALFVVRTHRRRRTAKATATVAATDDNGIDGIAYHTLSGSDHNGDNPRVPSSADPLALLASCTEIPASQLTDLRILGGGGFGVVYLVRDTQQDRLLASKRLAPKHTNAGAAPNTHNDEVDAFVAEINLAASLSHDRIVAFVGVAGLHKTALQALFEYMDGGDLRQYLDQRRPIADVDAEAGRSSWTREKLQIAVDVADALAYLHSLTPTPVVHRDLKSRNILLTAKDKRAKLGDFGVSRAASSATSMTTGVGTSRWVAPEVILGGGAYGPACDVYSLGVVLSELDTHRVPFSELAHANGEPLADFAVLELVATQGRQPSFCEACPAALLSLARLCLSFDATSRPSALEVGVALRAIQSELNEA